MLIYLCFSPQMQERDWLSCNTVFHVYECMFKVLQVVNINLTMAKPFGIWEFVYLIHSLAHSFTSCQLLVKG